MSKMTEKEKYERELAKLGAKMDKLNADYMKRLHAGAVTRARTTTYNREVALVAERMVWLKTELKALS